MFWVGPLFCSKEKGIVRLTEVNSTGIRIHEGEYGMDDIAYWENNVYLQFIIYCYALRFRYFLPDI